jgi:sulfonate dioxygenase
MQKYLESLTALHSADLQAQGSRDLGRTVRREPVTTEHPLIRTHPVTGWKSIFFNPGFVTKIVGVPKTESDHIIGLLFQWEQGDVAFWDNRVTVSISSYPEQREMQHVNFIIVEPLGFLWICATSTTRCACCCQG